MPIKEQIKKIPVVGDWAKRIYSIFKKNGTKFLGSSKYWENRYASGGNSGVGSYNKFAEFKANVLNAFVAEHEVNTVIEFGCGDGAQLELAKYRKYIGFDISETVITICKKKFSSDMNKTFRLMREYDGEIADLSLSLDVVYHLVEDEIFEDYMQALFKAAGRYVIIYSSDSDDNEGYADTHVWHRKFTKWIQENISDWKLLNHIANRYPYQGDYKTGSFADFYIYEKV